MSSKYRLGFIFLVVTLGCIFLLSNSAFPQQQEVHIYSAKFVCGISKGMDTSAVAQGRYSTVVNIHNFSDSTITVKKKAVLAFTQFDSARPPTQKLQVRIEPDGAFEIDCREISQWFNLSPDQFATGFVVIESQVKLDVVAVYTTEGLPGITPGVPSIDVERVPESNPEQVRETEVPGITIIIIVLTIIPILLILILICVCRRKK